jgi:nicotinate dehydrogenase subunit A
MPERIVFELNGRQQSVEVAPDTPLLYVLRNEFGLNNPHFGCGLAQCGACTVQIDGVPTRSCSVPTSLGRRVRRPQLHRPTSVSS